MEKKIKEIITKEELDETNYYWDEENYRCVIPYYFIYETFAKSRWIGKTILSVMSEEFPQYSKEYFEKKIQIGDIRINQKQIINSTIIQDMDKITHRVHRHEPKVIGDKITILENNEELLVINKPPSIPVHPCGRFRHNSIIFILAKEYNLINLYGIHRLDRLTSGILIFAKSQIVAKKYSKMIMDGLIEKEYIAKVKGKFPDNKIEINKPIKISKIPRISELNECSDNGKPCLTIFEKLSYNQKTNESIIKCIPKTGRSHQIRVHLHYLGFPIINDPLYGEKIIENNNEIENEKLNFIFNNDCSDCIKFSSISKNKKNDEITQNFMYLHAVSYYCKDWKYQCPFPHWAL